MVNNNNKRKLLPVGDNHNIALNEISWNADYSEDLIPKLLSHNFGFMV